MGGGHVGLDYKGFLVTDSDRGQRRGWCATRVSCIEADAYVLLIVGQGGHHQ